MFLVFRVEKATQICYNQHSNQFYKTTQKGGKGKYAILGYLGLRGNFNRFHQEEHMEEKVCFVNVNTGRLHYTGFCPQSKSKSREIQYFDSADDALAVFGRSMSYCKHCTQKRDNMLKVRKGAGK